MLFPSQQVGSLARSLQAEAQNVEGSYLPHRNSRKRYIGRSRHLGCSAVVNCSSYLQPFQLEAEWNRSHCSDF